MTAVRFLSDRLHEALAEHEELAHGLRGRARLGDHVEQALRHVEGVEELADEVGVDVVEDEEPRHALGSRDVVEGAREGGVESAVAEGRSADPKDHHVLELAGAERVLHGRRVVEDVPLDVVLVREIQPAEVLGPARLNGGERSLGRAGHGLQFRGVEPVLGADGGGEDVRVVESETVHGS